MKRLLNKNKINNSMNAILKMKNKIWSFLIVIMGLLLIHANGCTKADEKLTSITDKDGNVYRTVTIGTQIWMAENLKTIKYLNGDLIGTTSPFNKDILSEESPTYQWAYDGNESNVPTYGRLYTWYAANDNRKVCPTGWHLPTEAEWTTLTTYLGGERVSGVKLKEIGIIHWASLNFGSTNETGFTALPGGCRKTDGTYIVIGKTGYWWCATEYTTYSAWYRFIHYNYSDVFRDSNNKKLGLSVRCLRD